MTETKVMNNGVEIPVLGFGVYRIPDDETCIQSVLDAIDTGYRLFDTAAVYRNEASVGKAIAQSPVPREELFLTTKVWASHMGYTKTREALEESLKKLGTNYIDLYLIHEPMGDIYGSWRAMQDMYNEGMIRSIGVCNMWPDRLLDLILNADIIPQLVQIETHPFCQQDKTAVLLKEFNIIHEAWAPFAEGRENMFSNQILSAIGEHHNKTIAQVILRWLYQRGVVALTKSVHKERMEENRNIFDFELSPEEMNTIHLMDHDRPLILNNRDLEVVRRITPHSMG